MDTKVIDNFIQFVVGAEDNNIYYKDRVSYFRKIEDLVEACLSSEIEPCLKAKFFSIYILIEHLLTVLTGDVRYHTNSLNVAMQIFESMHDMIQALASLAQGDSDSSFFSQSYDRCIIMYIDKVAIINKLLQEESE